MLLRRISLFHILGRATGGAGAVVTATVAVSSSALTVTVAHNAGTGAGSGGGAWSGAVLSNGASGGWRIGCL